MVVRGKESSRTRSGITSEIRSGRWPLAAAGQSELGPVCVRPFVKGTPLDSCSPPQPHLHTPNMVTLASVGYFIRVSLTSSLCVFFLSSFLPSSKAPELAHPARQSSIVSSLLWLGATWAAVGVLAIVQSVRAGYWLGRNPEWKWVGESVVVGTLIWLYAAWTVANGESCSASWLKGLAFAALAGNSAMDVVLTLRAGTFAVAIVVAALAFMYKQV